MKLFENIRCQFAIWRSKRKVMADWRRMKKLNLHYNPQGPGFVMADYTLEDALASVGKGWWPIVERLWRLCKAQNPPVMVEQVKEKFGGLRFYVGGCSDEVYDVIVKGENESYTVCEDCGKPGRERPGGWVLTLCDECEERRSKLGARRYWQDS